MIDEMHFRKGTHYQGGEYAEADDERHLWKEEASDKVMNIVNTCNCQFKSVTLDKTEP